MSTRRSNDPEARERRQAAADLRAGHRALFAVRSLLTVRLVAGVLISLVQPIGWIPTAACAAALFLLRHRPFEAVLGVTLLDLALLAVHGEVPRTGPMLTHLGLWAATQQAWKLDRARRAHPDLYGARKLRGEHLTGDVPLDPISERRRGRRSRGDSGALGWALGAAVLAGAGLWWTLREPGPSDPGEDLERFREAWNTSSAEDMAAFARPESRSKFERSFLKAERKYGWEEGFPEAAAVEAGASQGERLEAVLHTEDGEVGLKLRWSEAGWQLSGVDFSAVADAAGR